MASDYNKLTDSVLVQLTKAELQALKDAAGKEGTTARNIIRRALKSYLADRISDELFTDRTQGNLSKENREPALNQLPA